MKLKNKLLFLIFIIIMLVPFSAIAEAGIRVTINEENIEFDQHPVIINGRTLVPIRAVCEKLGADVYWHSGELAVGVVKNDNKLFLTIDDEYFDKISIESFEEYSKLTLDEFEKRSERITLDAAPIIINGRTMLPIRAVCEALGAQVNWNEELRRVEISCPEKVINDKNTDITFFDKLFAQIDAIHLESHKKFKELFINDFDYMATITLSGITSSDDHTKIHEFIDAKTGLQLPLNNYIIDFTRNGEICILLGYNEGIDVNALVDSFNKESIFCIYDSDGNIIIEKSDIVDAQPYKNSLTENTGVEIILSENAKMKFASATERISNSQNNMLTVFLDGQILSTPQIMGKIDSGKFVVTGDNNYNKAELFAYLICTKTMLQDFNVAVKIEIEEN